jgi:DeoR family fructose operon transcriptional repressor
MTTPAETRRAEIIEALERERYLKTADLSRRLGVSPMSIRRALSLLEERGLARRAHGGLVATPLLRLGIEISPEFIHQIRDGYQEKEVIARAGAALVQPGDHLIFDCGALSYLTACSLSGELLFQGELTVITNSLPVALELAPWPGVETILLGGKYPATGRMNLVGPSTTHGLAGLHADKMFLSLDAFVNLDGLAISDSEAELEQQMVAACEQVILLAEWRKIGRVEQIKYLPLRSGCILVTNQGAPEELVSGLHSQGVEVRLA